MWLVTTAVAAAAATAANCFLAKRLKLGFLALMLWGSCVMILIDHILGYEGGTFLEKTTEGLISNSVLLGLVMLIPVFVIWGISLILSNIKRG